MRKIFILICFIVLIQSSIAEARVSLGTIGGGEDYGRWVTQQDFFVKNLDDLLMALKQVKANQVIYIDDDAQIQFSAVPTLLLPEGVTLASGRGRRGSLGALLHLNEERK